MKPQGRHRVYIFFGATIVMYLLGFVITFVDLTDGIPSSQSVFGEIGFQVLTLTFPVVGFLIATRHPNNVVGWILMGIGLSWAIPLSAYIDYAAAAKTIPLSTVHLLAALNSWTWVPPVGLLGTFLILLFPNGRLLSPRWKIVAWLSGFAMIGASIAIIFYPVELSEEGFPGVRNPLHIPALAGFFEVLQICLALFALCVVASAVSLVLRFRRSSGIERLQLKWLTLAAAILAGVYLIALVASFGYAWNTPRTPGWVSFIQTLASICFFLIPISIGISILRHRLFDIDIVINKTLVYGGLAAFITAVYVGIVVGIGSIVGAGGKPNFGLSLAATGIVALAFEPVRARTQQIANRLVYGQRVSPYEAITSFSHRVAESLSFDEVLPRMAEAAARGVNGVRSRATLFFPGGGTRSVGWPEDSTSDSFDRTLTIVHQGDSVGELSVAKAPGEQITSGDDDLLADLASQAGLAMRNLRLTAELQQKLIELQESRKRIVEAQDNERRRMERDIHDGAQQQLVSLAVKLSLAKNLLAKHPARAAGMLDEIKAETEHVVESVRDLARGIFPPLLAERGLGEALESHTRKTSAPVTIEDLTGRARFSPEVESAVYFTIREALQNASKHAPEALITVDLSTERDHLQFRVADQGPGFDMKLTKAGLGLGNMSDRIEAVGGEFRIKSSPGLGTTVEGRVPIRVAEPVP